MTSIKYYYICFEIVFVCGVEKRGFDLFSFYCYQFEFITLIKKYGFKSHNIQICSRLEYEQKIKDLLPILEKNIIIFYTGHGSDTKTHDYPLICPNGVDLFDITKNNS